MPRHLHPEGDLQQLRSEFGPVLEQRHQRLMLDRRHPKTPMDVDSTELRRRHVAPPAAQPMDATITATTDKIA